MEEPAGACAVTKKTIPDGAGERANQKSVPQTVSSAKNTGEKRKREGLIRREEESGSSSETEGVILVGDTKAIKDFGFGGGEESQKFASSKRQAFDVQSNRNRKGSLENEETGEEPERTREDSNLNDFDKLREERSFAAGQIWALYDTDGMPRLYAQIREVSVPGFGVTVTWLEPDPDDKEVHRYEKELPVSVGRFKLGKNECIKDQRRFSHVAHCNEGSSAGKFCVYPREGETWVLFTGRYKNYKTDWSLDPDSHQKYQNAFVEILPEFGDGSSVPRVAFLHKAKGFSSVFCRFTEQTHRYSIHNYGSYQFSHCVPSFKTMGTEAEGVPRGAYELDPAALPENIKEIDVPFHLLKEPTVSNFEDNTHSQCVYFASKGITFETGQIWSFCSGDDYLPRYYGKIQKITFVQAFEQDPVVKLHVSRLKATPIKGVN